MFQGNLIKRQLLGAFAGDVFKGDGLFAQILQRQRIHIMARGGGVEHIGCQHGVGKRADDSDLIVRQHRNIVLEVLTNLGFGWVFQQWF